MAGYNTVMEIYLIIAATAVGAVGMTLYLRDLVAGRTRPHAFTWILWGLLGSTACAYMLGSGERLAALPYFGQGVFCSGIAVYTLARWGWSDISRFDWLCLGLGLATLAGYIVARHELVTAVMVTLTDILAIMPTFRKSWHHPHGETLAAYLAGAFIDACTIFALSHRTLATVLYPGVIFTTQIVFCLMALARRRVIARTANT